MQQRRDFTVRMNMDAQIILWLLIPNGYVISLGPYPVLFWLCQTNVDVSCINFYETFAALAVHIVHPLKPHSIWFSSGNAIFDIRFHNLQSCILSIFSFFCKVTLLDPQLGKNMPTPIPSYLETFIQRQQT